MFGYFCFSQPTCNCRSAQTLAAPRSFDWFYRYCLITRIALCLKIISSLPWTRHGQITLQTSAFYTFQSLRNLHWNGQRMDHVQTSKDASKIAIHSGYMDAAAISTKFNTNNETTFAGKHANNSWMCCVQSNQLNQCDRILQQRTSFSITIIPTIDRNGIFQCRWQQSRWFHLLINVIFVSVIGLYIYSQHNTKGETEGKTYPYINIESTVNSYIFY